MVKHIYESTFELNDRIDELFDLAKSEVGILKVKLVKTNLCQLINDAVQTILPMTRVKDQRLISKVAPSLHECWVDSTRIRQVILNLLNNAVKFTPEYGKITVVAKNLDGAFLVKVIDNGPGISKEEQKYLFEPYHRLELIDECFGGLGLGLSISKTLIELHRGHLWVESEKGKGSSFCFSVPYMFQEE